MKLVITILFILSASLCAAQENKYDISAPIDVNQKGGWNKVLCLKNGNTLLFHFDVADKQILVKVFDSLHREVAGNDEKYSVVDLFQIEFAIFKGIYEINGEAVLFLQQDHMGKHRLIRVQYNTQTGMKTNETVIRESVSETKAIQFYVMKNKNEDGYAILYCMDISARRENEMSVIFYNKNHEAVNEAPLVVDRKKYKFLEVTGAELKPEGALITIALSEVSVQGSPISPGPFQPGATIYEHYLNFFFIPKGAKYAVPTLVDLSIGVFPSYSLYTYNSFANTVNVLLYSFREIINHFGLNLQMGGVSRNIFFKIDEQDRKSVAFNVLKYAKANDLLKQRTDTNRTFDGVPYYMHTDDNGVTTVVSTSYTQYGEPETRVRYNREDYMDNISVAQLDDDGNELWGALLPFHQYFKSYKHYYGQRYKPKWWQTEYIFNDLPAQVYGRQLVSVSIWRKNKNFYVVYNDYDKNFNNSIEKPGDTVYDFSVTNACYYKINNKKEVTKNYLFGTPAAGDFKCSFVEGADFDEQRGTYASLVQYKHNDEITLRMAWAKLD